MQTMNSVFFKIRLRSFSMSFEAWKSFFEWGGVGLGLFTLLFTAAALICANEINAEQEERLMQFEKDLIVAKTELAKAQEAAAIAQRQVASVATIELMHQGPRMVLDAKSFLSMLEEKPKANSIIQYEANDEEAHGLATQLQELLKTAGWNVAKPKPLKGIKVPFSKPDLGIRMEFGQTNKETEFALQSAIGLALGGGALISEGNASLPPNTFLILIGPKP
jgi:hypothetical protein